MAKEFKLPELGENIISADVLTVLVKPGDNIEKDQTVIEIETDKATIEVPSTVEGVIKEVLVKPGDKINVGAVLFTVESPPSKENSPKTSISVPHEDVPNVSKESKQGGSSISPAITVPSKGSAKVLPQQRSPDRKSVVVGKEWRYWRDWSSDVCSSDLP